MRWLSGLKGQLMFPGGHITDVLREKHTQAATVISGSRLYPRPTSIRDFFLDSADVHRAPSMQPRLESAGGVNATTKNAHRLGASTASQPQGQYVRIKPRHTGSSIDLALRCRSKLKRHKFLMLHGLAATDDGFETQRAPPQVPDEPLFLSLSLLRCSPLQATHLPVVA